MMKYHLFNTYWYRCTQLAAVTEGKVKPETFYQMVFFFMEGLLLELFINCPCHVAICDIWKGVFANISFFVPGPGKSSAELQDFDR